MSNSEILQAFDERRDSFKPYGLTCELWSPSVMNRPDRYNEIELNYFPKGTITYFFQDKKLLYPLSVTLTNQISSNYRPSKH
jgi:AraC family transcriptional regulator, melibiose operon regulatory protein